MLRCSASLWSADLTNLAAEIRRVEPYSERFHLDVADGHYVPSLLFFPDLVGRPIAAQHDDEAVRGASHDDRPDGLDRAVCRGRRIDGVIFCYDSPAASRRGDRSKPEALGKFVGISTTGHRTGLPSSTPFWGSIRSEVTIVGTPMGTKGTSMDASIPAKIRAARAAIEKQGARVEIQLDGGIRRDTVPLIDEAGADWIVPGSLMFGEDPAAMRPMVVAALM